MILMIVLLMFQTLERHFTSYIITYYLPSGLFVVVSWISFLIPPDIVPGTDISRYNFFWNIYFKKFYFILFISLGTFLFKIFEQFNPTSILWESFNWMSNFLMSDVTKVGWLFSSLFSLCLSIFSITSILILPKQRDSLPLRYGCWLVSYLFLVNRIHLASH